ncbi:hypothetical protein G9A89_018518 [Geosiphon pyriformis]|nr:hypothetical protein G9A89_018518 [Geosiphon pyriformis]
MAHSLILGTEIDHLLIRDKAKFFSFAPQSNNFDFTSFVMKRLLLAVPLSVLFIYVFNIYFDQYQTESNENVESLTFRLNNRTDPKSQVTEQELETLKNQARYAAATYCYKSHLAAWSCGCNCVGNVTVESIFHDQVKGAFGYVAVDKTEKAIIIGFRGTRDWTGWFYNLRYLQLDYDYPEVPGARIHGGFYEVYERVRESILWKIQWMLNREENSCGGYDVIISGHSLGGALSIFLGLDVKRYILNPILKGRSFGLPFNIKVTTIGEPRIGNDIFANLIYAEFSPENSGDLKHVVTRITNRNDLVPHLPPKNVGFLHHSHEIWIKNTTHTFHCDDSKLNGIDLVEDQNCLARKNLFDIGVHMYAWNIYFEPLC